MPIETIQNFTFLFVTITQPSFQHITAWCIEASALCGSVVSKWPQRGLRQSTGEPFLMVETTGGFVVSEALQTKWVE